MADHSIDPVGDEGNVLIDGNKPAGDTDLARCTNRYSRTSLIGRTSILPRRADGILEAT
jgi:hypothetical protein